MWYGLSFGVEGRKRCSMDTVHPPLLTVEDLTIGYPVKKGYSAPVAQHMSFTLWPGEIVCLVGPNGAGKTTLLKTLAGILKPLSGILQIKQHNIKTLSYVQRSALMSFVMAGRPDVQGLTAFELVSLGRYPYTNWRGELEQSDHDIIRASLEQMQAWHLSRRLFSELSDGESQRVLIARALAQTTPILLLDEPTAFLDLPRKVELLSLLRNYAWYEKKGIILSLHDIDLALRFADRLWLLSPEGISFSGVPEDLVLAGAISSVFSTENIHFDIGTGEWKLNGNGKGSSGRFVAVTGTSNELFWTCRALKRKEYTLVPPEKAKVSIFIRSGVDPFWDLSFPEMGERRVSSLAKTLELLDEYFNKVPH